MEAAISYPGGRNPRSVFAFVGDSTTTRVFDLLEIMLPASRKLLGNWAPGSDVPFQDIDDQVDRQSICIYRHFRSTVQWLACLHQFQHPSFRIGSPQQGANRLLREVVTEEEIAAIVSRWTGIPVSRLVEGERAKLLRLDEVDRKSVV